MNVESYHWACFRNRRSEKFVPSMNNLYQSQYIYIIHTYIKQLCIMSISDRFFFLFRKCFEYIFSFLSFYTYNFCLFKLLIFTFSNSIVQRPSLFSSILSSILILCLAVFLINFQFINTACNIHRVPSRI